MASITRVHTPQATTATKADVSHRFGEAEVSRVHSRIAATIPNTLARHTTIPRRHRDKMLACRANWSLRCRYRSAICNSCSLNKSIWIAILDISERNWPSCGVRQTDIRGEKPSASIIGEATASLVITVEGKPSRVRETHHPPASTSTTTGRVNRPLSDDRNASAIELVRFTHPTALQHYSTTETVTGLVRQNLMAPGDIRLSALPPEEGLPGWPG